MSSDRYDGADITRRIVRATSGSACRRAEALLASRTDSALEVFDLALLRGHLARCEACRALAEALDWSLPLLPALAEREPGEAFTEAVLERTSRAPQRALVPWLERGTVAAQERWRRMWQRPRFALEAAWVGACVVALLVWSPLAPVGAQQQARAAIQAGGTALPTLVQDAPRLGGELVAPLASPAGKIEVELDTTVQGLRERASHVAARGHSLWQSILGGGQHDDEGGADAGR